MKKKVTERDKELERMEYRSPTKVAPAELTSLSQNEGFRYFSNQIVAFEQLQIFKIE